MQFLAEQILKASGESGTIAGTSRRIREGGLLGKLLELRKSCRDRVVLVVDQLEDLVRHASDDEAVEFADQIATCLEADAQISLIATLRVGELREFLEHPSLTRLVGDRGLHAFAPMGPSSLARVIREPCRVGRIRIEDETLVDELIEGAQGVDALPLLAHLLHQLWQRINRERRREIRREDYQATGELKGALSRHANQVLTSLRPGERDALWEVLLGLAEMDDRGNISSRPLRVASLSTSGRAATDKLVEARLLVESRDSADVTTVQVAHDALLRHWDRARTLLEREEARLRALRYLRGWHATWEQADRNEERLLTTKQLRKVRGMARRRRLKNITGDPQLLAFYRMSVAHARLGRLKRAAVWAVLIMTPMIAVPAIMSRNAAEARATGARSQLIHGRLTSVQQKVGRVFRSAQRNAQLYVTQFAAWYPNTVLSEDLEDLATIADDSEGLSRAADHVHALNQFFRPIVEQDAELTSLMVVRAPAYEYLILEMGNGYFINRLVTERGRYVIENENEGDLGGVTVEPPGSRVAPAYEIAYHASDWPLTSDTPCGERTLDLDGVLHPSARAWPGRIVKAGDPVGADGEPWEGYDVKNRPWVEPLLDQESASSAWTPPTIFFVTKEPGLTHSSLIVQGDDRYILGLDYKLTEISLVSTQVDLGESGKACVLMASPHEESLESPLLVGLPSADGLGPDEVKHIFNVDKADVADGDPELPLLRDRNMQRQLARYDILSSIDVTVIESAWAHRTEASASSAPWISRIDQGPAAGYWVGIVSLTLGGVTSPMNVSEDVTKPVTLFIVVFAHERDLSEERAE